MAIETDDSCLIIKPNMLINENSQEIINGSEMRALINGRIVKCCIINKGTKDECQEVIDILTNNKKKKLISRDNSEPLINCVEVNFVMLCYCNYQSV